jgi:hypothetical protein
MLQVVFPGRGCHIGRCGCHAAGHSLRMVGIARRMGFELSNTSREGPSPVAANAMAISFRARSPSVLLGLSSATIDETRVHGAARLRASQLKTSSTESARGGHQSPAAPVMGSDESERPICSPSWLVRSTYLVAFRSENN